MKQIHYRIFRDESPTNTNLKINIPEDLFEYLSQPFVFVKKTQLLSPSVLKSIELFESKIMDLHFDILYDILYNVSGIGSPEIDELTTEDYQEDKIIVHVYLDTR